MKRVTFISNDDLNTYSVKWHDLTSLPYYLALNSTVLNNHSDTHAQHKWCIANNWTKLLSSKQYHCPTWRISSCKQCIIYHNALNIVLYKNHLELSQRCPFIFKRCDTINEVIHGNDVN